MATVLVVDDDDAVRFTLGEVLDEAGHTVIACASGSAALARAAEADVVLTDLAMPGMSGLELLQALRAKGVTAPVIVLTAQGSERAAVAAMKAGAWDYLKKPADMDELVLCVARAAESVALRAENRRLRIERAMGAELVGQSAVFRRVVADAERLAARDIPVLLRGESGTGKELIASLLHAAGPRAKGPLVRFNGAAIPAELAEAELFGHARGAFTGAGAARRGFFAQADGGTLVLDEVGELPMAVQPKLLRALQDGEIQPVGSGAVERVDVRVVASTHRDLAQRAREGSFREDLYYRLAVVELTLPSLRERREDIPALVECFRRRYARRFGLDTARFSPALIEALAGRAWPGNVRELENAVARILALSEGGDIGVEALSRLSAQTDPQGAPIAFTTLREQMAAHERAALAEALRACQGNQSEAARRLGLTRVTLIDKLKRHGLHGASSRVG